MKFCKDEILRGKDIKEEGLKIRIISVTVNMLNWTLLKIRKKLIILQNSKIFY